MTWSVDNDGFVYYLGRLSSMIKTAGANVSPAEVEKAIADVTGGAVAHVFGIPDPDRGQVVVAVIALDADVELDEPTLRRELAGRLSAYKIPPDGSPSSQPSAVPLLASGKPDLRYMKSLFDA